MFSSRTVLRQSHCKVEKVGLFPSNMAASRNVMGRLENNMAASRNDAVAKE
jgi:hypothetical protein